MLIIQEESASAGGEGLGGMPWEWEDPEIERLLMEEVPTEQ
jgi:hypothetical protein